MEAVQFLFLAGRDIGHCRNVVFLVQYCGPDCAVPCLYCGNLVVGKKLPEDPKPIFGFLCLLNTSKNRKKQFSEVAS